VKATDKGLAFLPVSIIFGLLSSATLIQCMASEKLKIPVHHHPQMLYYMEFLV